MANVNRVRIFGSMPDGEKWSINPNFATATGLPGADTFDELTQWAEAIAQLNTGSVLPFNVMQGLGKVVTIEGVRTELQDDSGKLLMAAEALLPKPVGGARAAIHPYQTAQVVTLLTGRPGRSYKGRLFLPALSRELDATTLRVNSVVNPLIAKDMAVWLESVAQALPGAVRIQPVVFSQKMNVATPVTAVSVGNLLDTMNRRRDALAEVYSVARLGAEVTPLP